MVFKSEDGITDCANTIKGERVKEVQELVCLGSKYMREENNQA